MIRYKLPSSSTLSRSSSRDDNQCDNDHKDVQNDESVIASDTGEVLGRRGSVAKLTDIFKGGHNVVVKRRSTSAGSSPRFASSTFASASSVLPDFSPSSNAAIAAVPDRRTNVRDLKKMSAETTTRSHPTEKENYTEPQASIGDLLKVFGQVGLSRTIMKDDANDRDRDQNQTKIVRQVSNSDDLLKTFPEKVLEYRYPFIEGFRKDPSERETDISLEIRRDSVSRRPVLNSALDRNESVLSRRSSNSALNRNESVLSQRPSNSALNRNESVLSRRTSNSALNRNESMLSQRPSNSALDRNESVLSRRTLNSPLDNRSDFALSRQNDKYAFIKTNFSRREGFQKEPEIAETNTSYSYDNLENTNSERTLDRPTFSDRKMSERNYSLANNFDKAERDRYQFKNDEREDKVDEQTSTKRVVEEEVILETWEEYHTVPVDEGAVGGSTSPLMRVKGGGNEETPLFQDKESALKHIMSLRSNEWERRSLAEMFSAYQSRGVLPISPKTNSSTTLSGGTEIAQFEYPIRRGQVFIENSIDTTSPARTLDVVPGCVNPGENEPNPFQTSFHLAKENPLYTNSEDWPDLIGRGRGRLS